MDNAAKELKPVKVQFVNVGHEHGGDYGITKAMAKVDGIYLACERYEEDGQKTTRHWYWDDDGWKTNKLYSSLSECLAERGYILEPEMKAANAQ